MYLFWGGMTCSWTTLFYVFQWIRDLDLFDHLKVNSGNCPRRKSNKICSIVVCDRMFCVRMMNTVFSTCITNISFRAQLHFIARRNFLTLLHQFFLFLFLHPNGSKIIYNKNVIRASNTHLPDWNIQKTLTTWNNTHIKTRELDLK